MTISTLAISLLSQWAPQHWFASDAPSRCKAVSRRPVVASTRSSDAINTIATSADSICAKGIKHRQIQPLRVVRLVELGQPRAQVGRMVISGRMADVCAELDRLAAGEAS